MNINLYYTLKLLQNSEFLSDLVTGAGRLNEGRNKNLGIASASGKAICTCDPYNKCACIAPDSSRVSNKQFPYNETTTLPSYSNITTTQFTQIPRDPNVSAERGKIISSPEDIIVLTDYFFGGEGYRTSIEQMIINSN